MNFFKDQDPLHTIKTEFNLQPDGDLNNLLQSSQFLAGSNQLQEMSKSGNRTAQHESEAKNQSLGQRWWLLVRSDRWAEYR